MTSLSRMKRPITHRARRWPTRTAISVLGLSLFLAGGSAARAQQPPAAPEAPRARTLFYGRAALPTAPAATTPAPATSNPLPPVPAPTRPALPAAPPFAQRLAPSAVPLPTGEP